MANIFTYQNQTYSTGDTVRLHLKVEEGDKQRTQIFEGLIISIKGSGTGKSITVRKIATNSIGVERIIPLMCPNLINIDKKTSGKIRRAKLYYLRNRIGRQASKVKTKLDSNQIKKSPKTITKKSTTISKTTKASTKNARSKQTPKRTSRRTSSQKSPSK